MKVILELDEEDIRSGYITATKADEKGQRRGKMPLNDVADLLREVFNWDAAGRQVKLISRFANSPFLAWGQNGAKWVAIKVIEPTEYYLVSVSGTAYQVRLPRLIARVGSHSSTFLFWTDAAELTPVTRIYPLMIGNIDSHGWVCLGSSGLKCKSPDEIDSYIRQVVEVPATGTYLPEKTKVDKLYAQLARGWAQGIGRRHGITLEKLLATEERG